MADEEQGVETREADEQQDGGKQVGMMEVPDVIHEEELPEWLRQDDTQPAVLHLPRTAGALVEGVQRLLELPSLEQRKRDAQRQLEKAEALEVESSEDAESATEAVRRLRAAEKRNKAAVSALIDPIRKRGLDPLYELRRELTNPLSDAQAKLKRKVKAWHEEQERKRRERERERQRKAQEEAEKRREEEFDKAVEEGDEERAEAIADNIDAPATPPPADEEEDEEEEAKQPEKTHYVDNWKMRLVGETEEEKEESLRKLVEAVADPDHPAPLSLLQLDQKRANKLADATSGEISFPGLEPWNDRTMVVRS